MRLIDPDKLYEDLANNLSSIMGDGSDGEAIDTYVTIGDIIHDTFNAQPTAYDVDAVVERLEKEKQTSTSAKAEAIIGMCGASANHYGGEECAYQRAIEIVKGGGADTIPMQAYR